MSELLAELPPSEQYILFTCSGIEDPHDVAIPMSQATELIGVDGSLRALQLHCDVDDITTEFGIGSPHLAAYMQYNRHLVHRSQIGDRAADEIAKRCARVGIDIVKG